MPSQSYSRQFKLFLMLAAGLWLFMLAQGADSLALGEPFQSPITENIINVPLITQGSGDKVSNLLAAPGDGVPILWLAILFLFLIGMTTVFAIRRRHR